MQSGETADERCEIGSVSAVGQEFGQRPGQFAGRYGRPFAPAGAGQTGPFAAEHRTGCSSATANGRRSCGFRRGYTCRCRFQRTPRLAAGGGVCAGLCADLGGCIGERLAWVKKPAATGFGSARNSGENPGAAVDGALQRTACRSSGCSDGGDGPAERCCGGQIGAKSGGVVDDRCKNGARLHAGFYESYAVGGVWVGTGGEEFAGADVVGLRGGGVEGAAELRWPPFRRLDQLESWSAGRIARPTLLVCKGYVVVAVGKQDGAFAGIWAVDWKDGSVHFESGGLVIEAGDGAAVA